MDNPLLSLSLDIPFDAILPEHVEPAIDALMAEARAKLDAIVRDPSLRTYDNTLGALESATERLELAVCVVSHLENVATTPALREAYTRTRPKTSQFFADISLDEGLYEAVRALAASPTVSQLDSQQKRFLDKTLDDFRRHGAELGREDKDRLRAIERELSELTNKFSQNSLDATNAFQLIVTDESRLSGLPDAAKEAARLDALERGETGFRFTLKAPSLVPILTYADDRELRRELYRAYNTRASHAPFDNRPVVLRILELRDQKAKLLGYADFSDLVLEDRMAKCGADASRFLQELLEKVRPAFEAENEELRQFVEELVGPSAPSLAPWDVAYYAEKLRRARYDFDEEELRQYFPVERVLEGLFGTATELYGLRVVLRDAPTWHQSVRTYDMRDGDDKTIAVFYADLFPRESKRDGAWMNGLLVGEGGEPHLGLFCSNVTPSVGTRAALLRHREVETLFHEFGHLLHHALTKVTIKSLAGTNVAWDFVELPSQIMENFCWERSALDLFARHHETGERLPDALYAKLSRARSFRAANHIMRQLGFGRLDLALHRQYRPERDGDLLAYARAIAEEHSPVGLPEDYAMLVSFGHLFSSPVGYAAGYYSYLWAEVLEADAFTRFKAEGTFNREVGRAFRESILERGNADDPLVLFERFMGRAPSLDALLERNGLSAARD